MFRKHGFAFLITTISVVALGILTNLATNFIPEDALPPLWLIWVALIVVSLIFIIFSFWQDRMPEHTHFSFHPILIDC